MVLFRVSGLIDKQKFVAIKIVSRFIYDCSQLIESDVTPTHCETMISWVVDCLQPDSVYKLCHRAVLVDL